MQGFDEADLREDLRTSATDKLNQALDVMAAGLRIQRDTLRRQNPALSEAELEAAFHAWLFADR
jgi:hypothetical protein